MPERLLRERRSTLLAGKAGLANLLHLIEQGQAANQLLPRHLAQRGKVDVAELRLPSPGVVVGARR